jgi:FMN phosphatase YigB (HAD superfamily)
MYDNVIVTDADGCFLYYEHAFHMMMVSKGYRANNKPCYRMEEKYNISKDEAEHLVRSFNESAALRRLPPVKDAIKYIRKLHEEHGYVFHCITAVPNTRDVYEARMENIENLFGKTAFERLTLCSHSAEKPKHLKEYEGTECYWIEDIVPNLKFGVDIGMNGLLMDRHYNRDNTPDFPHKRVRNWKEIYQIITGE